MEFQPTISTNWQIITIDSGVVTSEDTGIPVVIDTWYRIGFRWDPGVGGTIQGRINGSSVGLPISTNIPTGISISPFAKIDGTGNGGTEPVLDIDRWRLLGNELSND